MKSRYRCHNFATIFLKICHNFAQTIPKLSAIIFLWNKTANMRGRCGMELVQVYNEFVADSAGEVTATINTEYGINIEGLELEMNFIPPYLDEFHDDWRAFMCTIEDANLNMQFFFIVNVNTMKIVELQMIDLDVRHVA